MSYWSHNPELLDEITINFLPNEYREKVENGEMDLRDVPEKIRDKAMLDGEADYWGSKIDEAVMRHEDHQMSMVRTNGGNIKK